MYRKLNIHFIGIGGIGMSGIAEVLHNLGNKISGSDLKRSPVTDRLKRLGVRVAIKHKAKNVQDADVVVVSTAIDKTNPEVIEAIKRGIRIIRRAEMLAQIMRLIKYGIAVAGTHGKTTTTSLLATIVHEAGLDPTLIIGGRLNSLRTNAKLGKGDFIIAEADESDASFLHLLPTITIVTNMDPEHLDHYGDFDRYREAFQKFCSLVPFYGVNVLCAEHPETLKLSKQLDKRILLYGFSKTHDVNAQNVTFDGTSCHFDLFFKDREIDHIRLNTPGLHNVLNSLAAITVASELGISIKSTKKALAGFKGVGRRMELLLKKPEITVVDDYGHHPEEIKATLKAIRKAYAGRLVVIFQPHRYTRTRDLFEDFVGSFALADVLLITDIYAASEKPIKGVSSQSLVKAIQDLKGENVHYLPKTDAIVGQILPLLKTDDIVLSLGAGDITKIGRSLAKELKNRKL
jgi:UDP-N-acetylmuramate--alanine ligase